MELNNSSTKESKCYWCHEVIPNKELKEKAWYDGDGNHWHFKCGLIDGRFTV